MATFRKRLIAILMSISLIGSIFPISANTEETGNKAEEEKLISAWEWIDEEGYLDEETGTLALPGASEENPVYFEDVIALLPIQITATVENTGEIETESANETITLVDWECEDYPENGAYSGSYTFTATLPEGYMLADDANALEVIVELGGASVLAYTPVDRATLTPGGTFNVNNIPKGSTLGVDRYTMDQEGATYTITGRNEYDTVARFVITKSCTVILDNVSLTSGLTYEDDGISYYKSGNHGIFEIAEGINVKFVLHGSNMIHPKKYYTDSYLLLNGILLGEGSSITFSGDGYLNMDGTIARKFYDTAASNGKVIIEGGNVACNGFANMRYTGSDEFLNRVITIDYKNGSFENYYDVKAYDKNREQYYTYKCYGTNFVVEIPFIDSSNRSFGMKIGKDGSYSWIKYSISNSIFALYNYNGTNELDYYVINNNEYHHYKHTRASEFESEPRINEAIEVTDQNAIAGASGTINVGGSPANNATITFKRQGDDSIEFNASVTTDANGQYYKAMPLGEYNVSLKLSESTTVYDLGTITLTSEKKHTFDYSLSVLEGTVMDTDNNPLDNAVVSVENNGIIYSYTTGSDGKYQIVLPYNIGNSFEVSAIRLKSEKNTKTVTYQDGIITQNFNLSASSSTTIDIYTEEDLVILSSLGGQLSNQTINLQNDIYLTGKFNGIKYSGISGMTFDGNGHTIENMTTPLFYATSDSASLWNCHFTDLHLKGNISSDTYYVGAIAPYLTNASTVKNCSFEGSVETKRNKGYVGGLFGWSDISSNYSFENCFVYLTKITAKSSEGVGGISGIGKGKYQNCGVIIDHFDGSMEDDPYYKNAKAAIVGRLYDTATFTNCYTIVKGGTNTTVNRISGAYGGSWQTATCNNNFSYAPSGVFSNDETDKSHSTDLSETLMTAVAGSGTGENEALIDRLNTYASSNRFSTWYRRVDGYPSPIRGKFTITYSGGTKGSGSYDAVPVSQGDPVTLPGVVFKNADSIQTGWATTENGEKIYDLNASITPESNMTLYPYWESKQAASCDAPEGLTAYYGDKIGLISLPEGFTWNTPDELVGNVGPQTFTATYTPTGENAENYIKNTNVQISVEVKKAPSNFTTLVKASNPTYNRTAQELVTGGTTSDGTIVYSLTEEGEYTSTIPEATDAGLYTVYYKISGDKNHEDSNVGEIPVSIDKVDLTNAVITLGGDLTYNGTEQTQSIESVTIGNMTLVAGEYTIEDNTQTEPGSYFLNVIGNGNFKGSKQAAFTIQQKDAITVPEISKTYSHTVGSKNEMVQIDIASLLPTDRGATTYSLAENTATYVTEKEIGTDGMLSFKVTSGNLNDGTVLTVTAKSANYKDITVNININLGKSVLVEKEDAKVAITGSNTLIYGQKLSTLTLNTNNAKFVDDGDATLEVAGTLEWDSPDAVLPVGTTVATWKFIPSEPFANSYDILTGVVAITVEKATPNVIEVPTVTDRTYHPTTALLDGDLIGGKADVPGNWKWNTSGIVPTVDSSEYEAVFYPTDSSSYTTVVKTITVNVSKATPYVETLPTASSITKGNTLATSTLSGGKVQYSDNDATTVAGSFTWVDSSIQPSLDDSNTTNYQVIFTPSDMVNYNTVETAITLTVSEVVSPIVPPVISGGSGGSSSGGSSSGGNSSSESTTTNDNKTVSDILNETPETITNTITTGTKEQVVEIVDAALQTNNFEIIVNETEGTRKIETAKEVDATLGDVETAVSAILTKEELTDVATGKATAQIVLDVASENKTSNEVQISIESALPGGYNVGEVLDISLYKLINGEKQYVNSTEGEIEITVKLSDAMQSEANLKVIRTHTYEDGIIESVVLRSRNNGDGTLTFWTDKFSTYTIAYSNFDLSAYSDYKLNVYANSRVTHISKGNDGFAVNGYMWIDGVSPSNATWREIIFVNADDVDTSKAYRKSVDTVHNTYLNNNATATKNGTIDLSYAFYYVGVTPNNIQNYTKTSTGKMASGTYYMYMRISDGKNSYLFPLVDRVLSDGSTMESTGTLPEGFSIIDTDTRTLVYTVK